MNKNLFKLYVIFKTKLYEVYYDVNSLISKISCNKKFFFFYFRNHEDANGGDLTGLSGRIYWRNSFTGKKKIKFKIASFINPNQSFLSF